MENCKDKTSTLCVKLSHPEGSTVFNVICTEEQEKFLKFLSDISTNVSMNRYEPVMSVSEGVGYCESDALRQEKAFIFDASNL